MSQTPIKRKEQAEIPSNSDGAAGFAQVPGAEGLRPGAEGTGPPGATKIKRPEQSSVSGQPEPNHPMVPPHIPHTQQPLLEQNLVKPLDVPVPSGPNQGQSIAERAGSFFPRKEFFGSLDYKSTILVFFLVLIFSASLIPGLLRPYSPSMVGHDGRPTMLYAVVVAIFAAVLFLAIKTGAGF
jgi:hypothetical protein